MYSSRGIGGIQGCYNGTERQRQCPPVGLSGGCYKSMAPMFARTDTYTTLVTSRSETKRCCQGPFSLRPHCLCGTAKGSQSHSLFVSEEPRNGTELHGSELLLEFLAKLLFGKDSGLLHRPQRKANGCAARRGAQVVL